MPKCSETTLSVLGIDNSTSTAETQIANPENCFKSYDVSSIHERSTDDAKTLFSCPKCDKTFGDLIVLETHISSHTTKRSFKCTICRKAFRLHSSLTRHIEMMHFLVKSHSCDKCDEKFTVLEDLQYHQKSVHDETRSFVCQICSLAFMSKVVLMQHVNIHFDLKPNECKICKACFTSSGTLHNHMAVHSEVRAFQCEECDKGYKRKCHLSSHKCLTLKHAEKKD